MHIPHLAFLFVYHQFSLPVLYLGTRSAFGKLNSILLDILKIFTPKPKPSSIGKKWVRPDLRNENESEESKQLSARQASIKESDLVKGQILKPNSGNNTSDAS